MKTNPIKTEIFSMVILPSSFLLWIERTVTQKPNKVYVSTAHLNWRENFSLIQIPNGIDDRSCWLLYWYETRWNLLLSRHSNRILFSLSALDKERFTFAVKMDFIERKKVCIRNSNRIFRIKQQRKSMLRNLQFHFINYSVVLCNQLIYTQIQVMYIRSNGQYKLLKIDSWAFQMIQGKSCTASNTWLVQWPHFQLWLLSCRVWL